MRGSGLGGVVDLLSAGDGAPGCDEEVEWAHAARETSPRASESDRSLADAMPVSFLSVGFWPWAMGYWLFLFRNGF
jgi:hypothetical protein